MNTKLRWLADMEPNQKPVTADPSFIADFDELSDFSGDTSLEASSASPKMVHFVSAETMSSFRKPTFVKQQPGVSTRAIKEAGFFSFGRVTAIVGLLTLLGPSALAASSTTTVGARIKDIAQVKGVRENILIGYGLVVGLKGTGDSSTDVTSKSLGKLFGKLGLDVEKNTSVKSKNVAAVIVTSKLPPFARSGTQIDITVSSIGDAGSLEGGVLLVTPLRAGDQQVYAVGQGPVTLGSLTDGKSTFPTVGRIVSGATVEKDVDNNFSQKKSFRLALNNPDFTTASRLVALVNAELGGKFASSRDSATIDVVVPFNYDGNGVDLMARVENIRVVTDTKAKVVLNERTGTVVMGDKVSISPVAISQGDLSIQVKGQTTKDHIVELKPGERADRDRGLQNGNATVSDLVKLLNTLGVQPKDMTAIFQTIKATGALQADLELM
jgi:flagellar P-ring protein precursor FlgI